MVEDNLNGVTATIDKTIPTILEAGRQAVESTQELAQTVAYVAEDVSRAVDDIKTDTTINTAAKRFAATKPIIQEMTTTALDPNQQGKL